MAGQFGRRGGAALRTAPQQRALAPAAVMPMAPATVSPVTRPAHASATIPIATIAITVVLLFVFFAEQNYAVEPAAGSTPTHHTLVALGALSENLAFRDHQWWRLFTGPLLHGGFSHFLGNAVVLVVTGFLLEPLIGSTWFAALFVIGALGGSLASALDNPPNLITVGASGAIMALLGATFVCSHHDRAAAQCARMRKISLRLALPSLIPAYLNTAHSHVDYNAHFGGVLAGGIAGLILLALWRDEDSRPSCRPLAVGIIAAGVLAASVGFTELAIHYPMADVGAVSADGLIPDSVLPASTDEGIAASADLTGKYPNDPRGHMLRAMHFLRINDIADAKEQLHIALDHVGPVADALPHLEPTIRVMLAVTLVAQGSVSEAKDVAAPACGSVGDLQKLRQSLDYLRQSGICLEGGP